MPQTREHLAILRLLGVENILVVLNKCDLVDEEWLEMVEQQICEEMQQLLTVGQRNDQVEDKLEYNVDIVRVSAKSGSWNRRIKKSNPEMCKKAERNVENPAFPRLPVDRVFSIKGSGTVVTGTLLDGKIHSGDREMIYPQQTSCRVRGVQVHEQEAEACEAGQRSALNLVRPTEDRAVMGSLCIEEM